MEILLYSSSFSNMYGYGYGYGFDWTYILVIIGGILSMIASSNVQSTFNRYYKTASRSGLSGAEVARRILDSEGIYNVSVNHVSGNLTDHFNPSTLQVNLSDNVFSSSSVASIAVAAHECGHAIQNNEGYEPMKIRSAFVPVANFGSKVGLPIVILGFVFTAFSPLIKIGIVLFSFGMLFHLITLPVEFDASRRALIKLEELSILPADEHSSAKKVLSAAALTYVAAAAASVLSLIRIILIFGGNRRRD